MKDEDRSFRERLKKKRAEFGLTPGQLAIAVGVTEGAIRQMESGQTKSASFATGVKLALALNCDPFWLATGRPAPDLASQKWTFGGPLLSNPPPFLHKRPLPGNPPPRLPAASSEAETEPLSPTRREFQRLQSAVLTLGQKLGLAAELEGLLLQEIPASEATPPAKAKRSRRASGDRKG